jgi:cell division protein FtsN
VDEVLLRRLLGAGALLTIALLFSALLPEPGRRGQEQGVVAYDVRTGRQIGALSPVENPPELKADDKLAQRPAETQAPAVRAADPAATAEPRPEPSRPALKVDETLKAVGGWYVQVGSFNNAVNARGAAQKLFGMGLQTAIQSVSVAQTQWYRVRVGPFATEAAALDALARVKKADYRDAKLVRPDSATAKRN